MKFAPVETKQESVHVILAGCPTLTVAHFRAAISALKDIHNGKSISLSVGICCNFKDKLYIHSSVGDNAISDLRYALLHAFQSWQYYSGDYAFPVGGKSEYDCAYNMKWEGKSLWKRKRLINHCISVFEMCIIALNVASTDSTDSTSASITE